MVTDQTHLNIMHKITNLWKVNLNWLSKLLENNGRKNALVAQAVCFQMLDRDLEIEF